jgi:hypothetical protein
MRALFFCLLLLGVLGGVQAEAWIDYCDPAIEPPAGAVEPVIAYVKNLHGDGPSVAQVCSFFGEEGRGEVTFHWPVHESFEDLDFFYEMKCGFKPQNKIDCQDQKLAAKRRGSKDYFTITDTIPREQIKGLMDFVWQNIPTEQSVVAIERDVEIRDDMPAGTPFEQRRRPLMDNTFRVYIWGAKGSDTRILTVKYDCPDNIPCRCKIINDAGMVY